MEEHYERPKDVFVPKGSTAEDVITRQRVEELAAQVRSCQKNLFAINCRVAFLAVLLRSLDFRGRCRSLCDRLSIWRFGVVIVGMTLLGSSATIVGRNFTAEIFPLLSVGCIAAIVGGAIGVLLVLYPADSEITRRFQRTTLEFEIAKRQSQNSMVAWQHTRNEHGIAVSIHESLRRQLQLQQGKQDEEQRQIELERRSRKSRLLASDWRSLRSVPFEEFLAEVFVELGFVVEMTKTTGDQGVDLIVQKNGRRIAIQVKGYFDSVGNSAVQAAHTGMAYYRCSSCAVITNSRFTAAARDLAERVGCVLIDGEQIPTLIHGKLSFGLD